VKKHDYYQAGYELARLGSFCSARGLRLTYSPATAYPGLIEAHGDDLPHGDPLQGVRVRLETKPHWEDADSMRRFFEMLVVAEHEARRAAGK
jgi:hypothetical protein